MKLTQLLSSLSTPSTDQLVIPLHSDERLSSNRIRSTRSTILTFLPKQLYSEFSKIANLYFLFIAILQQIPGISTTGKMSVVFPLSVFITLAIIHEAYDEFKRYYADRMENEKPCRRLTPQGEIETLRWRDVAVGDVIELRQNELVPADTIVLATSLDDHVCYVETANLDGETNLKPRAVVDASLAADVHSIFSTPGTRCIHGSQACRKGVRGSAQQGPA
jgi:magnesium-transporting ATPase (P-type)